MTKKQFTTYKFRAFEEVHVNTDYGLTKGMVIGIDFGEWKFHVRFFPIDGIEVEDMWLSYSIVNRPNDNPGKAVNEPLFKIIKNQ